MSRNEHGMRVAKDPHINLRQRIEKQYLLANVNTSWYPLPTPVSPDYKFFMPTGRPDLIKIQRKSR